MMKMPKFADDFTPFIKYNAQLGEFRIREDDSENEIKVDVPKFVIDLENIKSGWFLFPTGTGTSMQRQWDEIPGTRSPHPGDANDWKWGFEVLTYSSRIGLRVLTGVSLALKKAMDSMIEQYSKEAAKHPGTYPVFQMIDRIGVKNKHGSTNYTPIMQLVSWVKTTDVPQLDQEEKQELLPPPPQQPRRIAATVPNGADTTSWAQGRANISPDYQQGRQFATQDHGNWKSSTATQAIQQQNDDPLADDGDEIPF